MKRRLICILLIAVASAVGASDASAQAGDAQVRGSPDAPVEMTVFSDFECPYCRAFALAVLPAITAEFVDRGLLRIRFVHLPLEGIHPNSNAAARAGYCAGRAGRFWAYHDYLFVRQAEWEGTPAPDSLWVGYARNLGLDTSAFSECLRSQEAASVVQSQLREAIAAGATGTPTIVLQGRAVAGLASYDEVRARILRALETAAPSSDSGGRQ